MGPKRKGKDQGRIKIKIRKGTITLDIIYQTRGRVFPPISKHREVGWKNEAQPRFFNQLRGVWK